MARGNEQRTSEGRSPTLFKARRASSALRHSAPLPGSLILQCVANTADALETPMPGEVEGRGGSNPEVSRSSDPDARISPTTEPHANAMRVRGKM